MMETAETVCHFNSGAGYFAEILHATGVNSGSNMLSALRKIDATRIQRVAKSHQKLV